MKFDHQKYISPFSVYKIQTFILFLFVFKNLQKSPTEITKKLTNRLYFIDYCDNSFNNTF